MADYTKVMTDGANVSEEDQKKAGTPIAGDMTIEVKNYLKSLIKLVDDGEIDLYDAQSVLNHDVYNTLDDEWKEKADLALVNLMSELQLIVDFYKSTETPDESPQLETMVQQFWSTKQKIEEHHDVFKF